MEGLVDASEYVQAYDAATDAQESFAGDVRLRQLQALALSGTGAIGKAIAVLLALRAEGHEDEETLGILASAHKRLFEQSSRPEPATAHARAAQALYMESYRRTRGIWSGIDAAALSVVLGDLDEAQAVARAVAEDCRTRLESTAHGDDTYWVLASLAEAHLILGDQARAEDCYSQAAAAGRDRWTRIAATRRSARLILRHIGADPGWVDRCPPIPDVAALVGHMVDRPGRPIPRFAPEIERHAADAVAVELRRHSVGIGYASAACGSDVLFHEALAALGGRSHVVLPYAEAQFVADSVDRAGSGAWQACLHRGSRTGVARRAEPTAHGFTGGIVPGGARGARWPGIPLFPDPRAGRVRDAAPGFPGALG